MEDLAAVAEAALVAAEEVGVAEVTSAEDRVAVALVEIGSRVS